MVIRSTPSNTSLLPDEYMRYALKSLEISPLSRPKLLVYMSNKLAIDLEGWY